MLNIRVDMMCDRCKGSMGAKAFPGNRGKEDLYMCIEPCLTCKAELVSASQGIIDGHHPGGKIETFTRKARVVLENSVTS